MKIKQCENLYYRKSFLQKSLPELKLAFSINYSISSLLFQTASRKVFLIVSNCCQESFSTNIFAVHYPTAGKRFCSCTHANAQCALLPCDCCYQLQGKVMFSQVCLILSTMGLMDTGSLLILITVRSVRILLECILVAICF